MNLYSLGFADDRTITEKIRIAIDMHIKVVLILPINMPQKSWRADSTLYWLCHQTFLHNHKDKRKEAVWQRKTSLFYDLTDFTK